LRRVDRGVRQGFITEDEERHHQTCSAGASIPASPTKAYTALERLYGEVRRLELFRPRRARWEDDNGA
jgi:hypothetical protein